LPIIVDSYRKLEPELFRKSMNAFWIQGLVGLMVIESDDFQPSGVKNSNRER
jgi:hypothetical protein